MNQKFSFCTGIILAGGQNQRFSGTNKALIHVGGERILDRVYGILDSLFEEIILVTNDPVQYLEWDFTIVTDIFPIRSSLTGLYTGLFYASTPYAFFTACDTPFLKKELVETIVAGIESNIDIVVPETAKGPEPLCSVYSKQCLKPIERQLLKQDLKIQRFFKNVRIKRIPEQLLCQTDPELLSFFNINTPDDLDRAEILEQQQCGDSP